MCHSNNNFFSNDTNRKLLAKSYDARLECDATLEPEDRTANAASCDNKKVSDIDGAQESTCTVPQADPAVSRFAVMVQL